MFSVFGLPRSAFVETFFFSLRGKIYVSWKGVREGVGDGTGSSLVEVKYRVVFGEVIKMFCLFHVGVRAVRVGDDKIKICTDGCDLFM